MAKNTDKYKIDEVKMITLGDGQVGKSSLIIQFIENKFSFTYLSTIGLDFKQKTVTLPNNKEVKIRIFDTAGQERFKSIAVNYIKKANGVLLVYDITSQESFNSVGKWINDIKEAMGDKVCMILVGNKIDLPKRVITKEMGEKKAQEFNIHFYETSCKTGENVEKAFFDLAEQILIKTNGKEENNIKLVTKVKKKNKCCL